MLYFRHWFNILKYIRVKVLLKHFVLSQFMIFYYYLLLMLIIKHIIISINLIDSSSYHYCNQRRTFLAYSKFFEHLYSLVIKSGMFPFWNNFTSDTETLEFGNIFNKHKTLHSSYTFHLFIHNFFPFQRRHKVVWHYNYTKICIKF